jgi:hypothetical protein
VGDATLAWTLFGISIGALVSVLISLGIAWISGAIVPGSRADKAEAAAAVLREAYDTLKIPVQKFDIESDLLGAVLRANHAVAAGTTPPPLPPTTVHPG